MKKILAILCLCLCARTVYAQSYFYGNTGSVPLTSYSQVVALWSSCSGVQYLGQDGNCYSQGVGTVTASGTPAQYDFPYWTSATNLAKVTAPAIKGEFYPCYILTSDAAGAPAICQKGYKSRGVTGTTNTDIILYNDNDVEYTGSVAVATALPTATTLESAAFAVELVNRTTGSNTAVTVTPATWQISKNGGTPGATLTIDQGQSCFVYVVPAGSAWDANCHDAPISAGSGVTLTRSAGGLSVASTAPAGGSTGQAQVNSANVLAGIPYQLLPPFISGITGTGANNSRWTHADNTGGIQTAITALGAPNGTTQRGGKLSLPAGSFSIATPITLGLGFNLSGDSMGNTTGANGETEGTAGTELHLAAAGQAINFSGYYNMVHDLNVYGNTPHTINSANSCIYTNGSGGATYLFNLIVNNCGVGMYAGASTGMDTDYIFNSQIVENGIGIETVSGALIGDLDMVGNDFADNNSQGVYFKQIASNNNDGIVAFNRWLRNCRATGTNPASAPACSTDPANAVLSGNHMSYVGNVSYKPGYCYPTDSNCTSGTTNPADGFILKGSYNSFVGGISTDAPTGQSGIHVQVDDIGSVPSAHNIIAYPSLQNNDTDITVDVSVFDTRIYVPDAVVVDNGSRTAVNNYGTNPGDPNTTGNTTTWNAHNKYTGLFIWDTSNSILNLYQGYGLTPTRFQFAAYGTPLAGNTVLPNGATATTQTTADTSTDVATDAFVHAVAGGATSGPNESVYSFEYNFFFVGNSCTANKLAGWLLHEIGSPGTYKGCTLSSALAPYFGQAGIDSGATSGAGENYALDQIGSAFNLATLTNWNWAATVEPVSQVTDTAIRLGWESITNTSVVPANGIYVRFDTNLSDTQWMICSDSTSAETCGVIGAGLAPSATRFDTFTITSTVAGTISATVTRGDTHAVSAATTVCPSACTVTASLPSASLYPAAEIVAYAAPTYGESLYLNYMSFNLTGLARP